MEGRIYTPVNGQVKMQYFAHLASSDEPQGGKKSWEPGLPGEGPFPVHSLFSLPSKGQCPSPGLEDRRFM